ncbi:hypothetical protein FORC065_4343 [Yersinia enterocolitica]|nr:hypothetical protein FORC065_4343 [Yersinia enterocolitica]
MICESAREVSLQRKYQNQKLRCSAQKKTKVSMWVLLIDK